MKYPLFNTIAAAALMIFGLVPAAMGEPLSAEEKERASELYKKFTKLKTDLPARSKVVKEMLEMGATVAKVIHPIIDREFRAAEPRYREGFARQAKTVAQKAGAREKRERVKKLRGQVQALRREKKLSKEQIKRIGDPALDELRKLTKIDAGDILDSSAKLAAARADLLALGEQRNACIDELLLVKLEPFDADELADAEKKVAAGAMSEDREARKILAKNEELADDVEPAEAEAIRDLNELRMLVELRPCLIDPRLCAAARGHSKDMAEKGFFAHESPVPGKKEFTQRAKLEGTSSNSENIYVGSTKGSSANRGWWHSPGHHKNMLSPGARRVGMGVHGKHWTQMFGG